MGNRLSRIVTRTGDDGTTGLGDGTRVPKESARIEAIGAVDELNSALGVLLAQPLPQSAHPSSHGTPTQAPPTRQWLLEIQQRLFDLGGELAVPGLSILNDSQVEQLERQLEALNATLPPLKEFVLPGGSPAAAACHLARAVCRRAERRCWALLHAAEAAHTGGATGAGGAAGAPAPSAVGLRYLNRLSDLLFVLARFYARAAGSGEALWQHERR